MAQLYEIFRGEELEIAEKIQRRRYQLLVHSYIYYELDNNLIPDSQWSQWATELAELQYKYPEISSQVIYTEDFEDWDGSTGAFLNFKNKSNIVATARRLLQKSNPVPVVKPKPAPVKKTKPAGRKLF